jgi:hypothetical protein
VLADPSSPIPAPWPNLPTPSPSTTANPAPAHLPGQHPRPASCPWPPPPAGRHPGPGRRRSAGRGAVDHRDRRVGRRRTPAGPGRARRPPPRSRPLQRPGRDHHPPHARPVRRPGAGRRHRRVAGRPRRQGPWQSRRWSAAGRRGRRQDPAWRPRCHRRRPPGPPAGPHGPHHPRGAGPTPGRRRSRGGSRVRPGCWPTWI